MKKILIMTVTVISILLTSACGSSHKKDPYSNEIITQEVVLPDNTIGRIVVSLSKDSTYIITFKHSLPLFHQFHEEKYFFKLHDNYFEDSIVTNEQPYLDRYIVGEASKTGWKAPKRYTTVDINIIVDSVRFFWPLAKIEFIPDNAMNPKRIERVVYWEAKQNIKITQSGTSKSKNKKD